MHIFVPIFLTYIIIINSLIVTEILTLWRIMSLVSLGLVLLMVMTRIMTRMIIINFSDIDF